jgi:uncharacterized membrane protein YgdD (TMEM256/DUF423 family)
MERRGLDFDKIRMWALIACVGGLVLFIGVVKFILRIIQ